MKVSIVIPVVSINDYIRESIPHILSMDYNDFEVLILVEEESDETFEKICIILTGRVGPAEKRDISIKYAKGEVLAFLDDDAFPEPDWLTRAVNHFEDKDVFAVGGPAVTPDTDSFWQRVSGAVFLTKVGGGSPERYWPIGNVHEVDDWPSVNLLVRKDAFTKVGGFKSQFWPGEDTKLCLDLIDAGGKIIYDPTVKVWHHRRSGVIKHLNQVGNYGLHRGFFAKKYPENSLKLKYFIPSIFTLFIIISIAITIFIKPTGKFILYGYIIYGIALLYGFFDIFKKEKNVSISLFAIFYIIFTHLWYGLRFLQGFLLKTNLKSKLRK